MAMPKVLDWLDDLVAQVATNVTNIAKNASDIAAHKAEFDTHAADDNRHWTETDRQNFDRTIHFKGYFVSTEKLEEAYPQGQLGDYAIVGGSDTVWLWDDETSSWLNSTEQGIVISVNGKTGEIVLSKTDVGLSNVDNTSDMNKPVSTAQLTALNQKTDRRQITLAEAETVELRSGTYFIQSESVTILGTTATDWVVIVGEQASNQLSASQIWIPYTTAALTRMFFRHQKYDGETNTNYWGEFVEVLTTLHLATLANDINEIKTNVQTNATDISDLDSNKADRGSINLEQANSLTLKAGIYWLAQELTINGYKDNFWTVIVGDYVRGINSVTQIWMPFAYAYANDKTPKMFLRRSRYSAENVTEDIAEEDYWTDFVEVITTGIISNDEIERAKQYKGYFPQVTDLKAEYTTATDGDYAIVGNALYIWDSRTTSWVEVSGSGGGSTGTGRWSVKQYSAEEATYREASLEYLVGKSLENQIEVYDTDEYFFNQSTVDYKCYLIETYVNMNEATTISTNELYHDDGMAIYINNKQIYNNQTTLSEAASLEFDLVQGWNKIQIVVLELTGSEVARLGVKLTDNLNCLMMDCYHYNNEPVENAYVPLTGDSVIKGSVTVTETVGITEKSYIQYNEDDNSISFMFNE